MKDQEMTEQEIIRGCQSENRDAQRALYNRWGPLLMGVIRRYVSSADDAEDVFVEAMYKILSKIEMFRDEGSFEGWMRRIATNEALMYLRKHNNFHLVREIEPWDAQEPASIEHELYVEEILALLDELPAGYRTIFNLYVIEGYKHREIADLLGISINTSKSQLILAKKRMQELVKKNMSKTG